MIGRPEDNSWIKILAEFGLTLEDQARWEEAERREREEQASREDVARGGEGGAA